MSMKPFLLASTLAIVLCASTPARAQFYGGGTYIGVGGPSSFFSFSSGPVVGPMFAPSVVGAAPVVAAPATVVAPGAVVNPFVAAAPGVVVAPSPVIVSRPYGVYRPGWGPRPFYGPRPMYGRRVWW
jgi:hypothetical protein